MPINSTADKCKSTPFADDDPEIPDILGNDPGFQSCYDRTKFPHVPEEAFGEPPKHLQDYADHMARWRIDNPPEATADDFWNDCRRDPRLGGWIEAGGAGRFHETWDRAQRLHLQERIEEIKRKGREETERENRERQGWLKGEHALVDIEGKTLVLNLQEDGDVTYSVPADLHHRFANEFVMVGKKRTTVSKAWMESPRRKLFAGGVTFTPTGGDDPNTFNLWRGFAVRPKQDRDGCRLFMKHAREVICGGNDANFKWLMGWLAHLIQKPEDKPGTSTITRGLKGSGKDVFWNYVGALFPRNHVRVSHPEHLIGRFNSHLERALLLHAEETVWAGDRQAESVLKSLITAPTIQIERKFVPTREVPSFLRLAISSNADWIVPATADERRFFVLDVSPHRVGDREYFDALVAEQRNGGLAALLYELKNFNLADAETVHSFDVRKPPNTEALARQKLATLKNIEAWWCDVLESGELPGDWFESDGSNWETESVTVSRDSLRRSYEEFMSKRRWQGEMLDATQFGIRLRKLVPNVTSVHPRGQAGRVRSYVIPSLESCREAFEETFGTTGTTEND